jgi:hypothetical protein
MLKKLQLLLLGLMATSCLMAQSTPKSVSINESDIQFWTGTGSNSTVVAIGWDDDDASYTPTVVVWGIHWSGTITLLDALDTLMAYDSRFSYSISGSYLTGVSYIDPAASVSLTPSAGWNCNNYNGVYGFTNLSTSTWLRISESTCDNYNFTGVNNLIYASNPNASDDVPEDASFAASDILYWVGEGNNQTVIAFNWADTALAWGYRFSTESVSMATVLSDIAAADPRFNYVTGLYGVDDITFTDGDLNLSITPGSWWWSLLNHAGGMGMGDMLQNGDFYKWGDLSVAIITDSTFMDYGEYSYWDYTYVWPYAISPVSVPTPVGPSVEEATIDPSAIEYWVGEGNSYAILAVNWADTCLAWGYRFNGEKTVANMMDDIAAADPRFSYTLDGGYLSDINFTAGNRTLGITSGNWWSSTNNGFMDMGLGQTLSNGDLEKWADPTAGVIVDSTYDDTYNNWWYTYAYPMTIYAVSQPEGMGPFCGKVGTEGCTAVPANSSAIKGWATGCTLELGPQNISIEGSPLVSYKTAEEAIGPCTMNDNLSVVSLGDGGSATLTFEKPIINGNGYDFAVYENSFDDYFLELAFVEVSSDGQRFVRFPATSLTQTVRQVTAKVDPTYINNLAGKYKTGYGTPFDLEELRDSTGIDINNITHIRIVDVVGSIDPQYGTYDAFGHIVNDPFPTNSYSSGFDLDGIAVLHQKGEGIDEAETVVSIYPNPVSEVMNITVNEEMEAQLFDMSGRCLMTISLHCGANAVSLNGISNGIYLLRTPAGIQKIVKK